MDLFSKIEMPLVTVLADMEITGVNVDVDYLNKMGEDLKEKMNSVSSEIYNLAGCEFNILSPKQLADVLFVKMEIPYPKKVKDNSYSTSKDILDKIIDFNPIVAKIEEYNMYKE